MLQKSVNELNEEFDSLKKQYCFLSSEIKRSTDLLQEKGIQYETLSEKLCSLNKESMVTEKKEQIANNRILFLQNKIPSLGNEYTQINLEVKDSEKKIEHLKKQKQHYEENCLKSQQSAEHILNEITKKENINTLLFVDIQNAEKEKKLLFDEISKNLFKNSDKKLKTQKELDEVSTKFLTLANEREVINLEFDEKRNSVNQLTEKLNELKKTHTFITKTIEFENQLNVLKPLLKNLEQEADKAQKEALSLEKELGESNSNLKNFMTQNTKNRDSLSSLENEVKAYDDLVLKVQTCKKLLTKSKESVDKALSDLKGLFGEHIKIKKDFYMKTESPDAIHPFANKIDTSAQ